MRRLNTSPRKSAIRGTGPSSHLLDTVMSRFPINNTVDEEDYQSGEESLRDKEENEEEERDRSVTPPPLIPNPPWMASPATPLQNSTQEEESNRPRPFGRQTSLCISPNSSQLHNPFLTPARLFGNEVRAFDESFPMMGSFSSPVRPPMPSSSDPPVTPMRMSSTKQNLFRTPLFADHFSDTRLEDELARMSRADTESPGGFFGGVGLYQSPTMPGNTPRTRRRRLE